MHPHRPMLLSLLIAIPLIAPTTSVRAAQHPKPHAAGATRINPKDRAVMVYVPAGSFLMGDNDLAADKLAFPRHTVTLDAFWIYKNDVTVAQYRKFCQATGTEMPAAPDWGWKDDHPVVKVSWDDAKAYCDWAGASLPTQAQWEKAARGTDGRKYPWGDEWNPGKLQCWQELLGTAAVGHYPAGASPYGCLDMAGNVWQWCADWYDDNYMKNGTATNPAGPETGNARVLRGGS